MVIQIIFQKCILDLLCKIIIQYIGLTESYMI